MELPDAIGSALEEPAREAEESEQAASEEAAALEILSFSLPLASE